MSQPLINGIPEVASSEIRRNFMKITTSVTTSDSRCSRSSFFGDKPIFLEAAHFCHNLLI
ncbi:hypothetical protein CI258_008230 [Enterococcus faecium]|nr:hypothetical protein CI258_008230 [Enterococcus faecium]